MLREKEELIDVINDNIIEISGNKNAIVEIKEQLSKNGITGGRVESVLSNPEVLLEADQRELTLFTEQFFKKSSLVVLDPDEWFTDVEIRNARQYDDRAFSEVDLDMEVIFENVNIVGQNVFSTTIDIAKISELMDAQVLYYDYDIQRQAKRQKDGTRKATAYKKNVREIREKLLNKHLKPTTIVFNATVGSGEHGEELIYDSILRTITLSQGVKLAILDGYHRCLGSIDAYRRDPSLKFNFILELTNYTKREAQMFQADHAKATPIPKTRIEMFEAKRLADTVTQYLMTDSELKDRVASQHTITPSAGELVSYSVLTNAIETEFPMEFRRDTKKVEKYLGEFFDNLIADYSEEFVYNRDKEKTLMNYNKMFAGYVALAARMKKENIEIDNLYNILKKINFSRTNPLWVELGILNNEGKVSARADERKIANYFKEIEL